MIPKMPRFAYIVYRVLEMLVSLFSRFLNAGFFGGSTYQTTSARAHIETGRAWRVGRCIINGIFFWQDDHCHWAYWREVEEAHKTLARAER